ncbi:MAG: hypothetical protein A2445_04530 [Candidatus Jacksonbacteria bacterium RIFOXYC2_FULL_44_29]|nr:MAG: hypothetical protein UV19_C0003G0029 [Parcubacteria group bacterium GW2011_GWA2_42_28]KKT55848.1 MAG: hypothetical protein UW45_C0004G0029 [Parcubacteria group bacterium GW2011_GWC2_44_22]OGY75626.1 MAG: hypothetical protein A2240_03720 [Candidatus Jacksonbacteria bacterium RIFOXYA2_FULL_43_12]OGY78324.1 MAG: hypothetical protein A2445_04530 [Candidatus Jacksonbacteria bacterium RIFOXYC2_FULL_44_29]OGY81528.1 MAG: hypothetical protein A2550_00815 [Candidatus Jacksonbacteria bacterium RI
MNIVYYYNVHLKYAPVKAFLTKYAIKSTDTVKVKEKKIKVLAFIDQAIQFIREHKGKPIPPIAKTIRGYSFHELRIKEGDQLIRILYFAYHQEQLVLLNAFEKPELYLKGAKKKIEREIQKILELTDLYYQDFITNPKHYAEYY